MLNQSSSGCDNKLSFDGAYNNLSIDNIQKNKDTINRNQLESNPAPYLDRPVIFFKNNMVLFLYGIIRDSIEFKNELIPLTKKNIYLYNLGTWGTYNCINDTIKAIIYMDYYDSPLNGRRKKILSYFEGIIKNKDTILQWHLVKPYPSVAENYDMNKIDFEDLKKGRNLYFKNATSIAMINPEKAWINKFKIK